MSTLNGNSLNHFLIYPVIGIEVAINLLKGFLWKQNNEVDVNWR